MLAWCLSPESPNFSAIDNALQCKESTSDMLVALDSLNYQYQQMAQRVCRMLRALYDTGFAAFA